MKNKFIKILEILLASALIIGLFVVVRQSSDYKKGQQDYDEAEKIANFFEESEVSAPSVETVLKEPTAEDPYAAMLKEKIDFAALKEINNDVQGWIEIPDTQLSYPILQYEDNDYYLKHTWKEEPNSVGSIYFECQVDPGLADFNTIIYGHRMRDLSMFGSLKYYEKISYWEEHPSVYVVTEEEAYRYDIYAAYKASPEDIVYGLKINSRPKKQELIQFGLEHSIIDTGIVPSTFDRILTLSTCTGSGHASRWVVQAVYRMESGTPEGVGNIFEGTDDISEETSKNSADTFTISEDTDNSEINKQSKWNIFGIYIQVIVFIELLIIVIVKIIITLIQYFQNRKKDKE